MKHTRVFALLVAMATLTVGSFAQTIDIRIATVAPEKTPYGKVLQKMVAEWQQLSGGKVRLMPFYGDKLGDEESIVQKIRANKLQGAMLTLAGLAYIDKPLMTISAPLLIQDDAELMHVLNTLRPEMDQRLADKGFAAITYSPAGWLQFFGKTELRTPQDLKKAKLGISNKSKEIYAAFQDMNYTIVNVDIAETTSALLTGRADAIFTSPMVAGAYNWVGVSRYMIDLQISPFFGGLIINDKAWSRIDPDLQKKLIESANRLAYTELYGGLEKLTRDSIDTMVKTKGGAILVKLTDAEKQQWIKELEGGLQVTLGKAFDRDMYNKVKAIVDDYRKKQAK